MTNNAQPTPEPAVPPERPRLAREFGELLVASQKPGFVHDVVIVGSGYGGSVAAETLARSVKQDGTRVSVCVLERGKEYLPGEFPKRFEDLPGHMRRTNEATGLVTGDPQGLFDVRMGPDVATLLANGVGGGSLINAGVLLEPDLGDFDTSSEAYALVSALKNKKDRWYEKAFKALGGLSKGGTGGKNTIALHRNAAHVRKTAALKMLGANMDPPAITVAMATGPNSAGVQLSECQLCGDCMTGCNVGAKDSLDANLLDLAVRAGARVYTGASVLSVERGHHKKGEEDFWVLNVCHTDPSLQKRETRPAEIRARHVILAAGTLGSTEILLRSRTDKLVFSPRLGQGFSCNGDNLAAVYDLGTATNGCADEDVPLDERLVGPTITGSVTMKTMADTPAERSFQLQEFSVPGPMKRIFEELVTTAKAFNDLPLCDPARHGDEPADALDPLAVDDAAMDRTLLVGMIGHDAADGVLYLPHPLPPLKEPAPQGTVGIRWQDARKGPRLDDSHDGVNKVVEKLRPKGATTPTLVANPMWRLLPEKLESLIAQPRGPVLTVHPLGGCRIGPREIDEDDAGVVDEYGRVYDFCLPSQGVFKTLAVLDGSIIPGSLGVNPSLTITATAMRAMEQLCKDWCYETAPKPVPIVRARRRAEVAEVSGRVDGPEPPAGRGTTEVQVVERLRGEVPLSFGGRTHKCIVELTLAYRSLPIGQLMGKLRRRMIVDASGEASRIRIFDAQEWEAYHLKLERDEVRAHWLLFEGRLGGSLAVLGREPSRPWQRILNSVSAWFVNRGAREIAHRLLRPTPAQKAGDDGGVLEYGLSLLRMGTRAGEVRRLDYDLAIGEVLGRQGDRTQVDARDLRIGAGDVIRGSKRLTYGLRANPWRQLTLLALDEMPTMPDVQPPLLELDGRFLAGQGFPLLRITRQRNSAVALADLASFGLYMTRVLASTHLWTFRKPDDQPRRKPDRLPGPVAGLAEPEITELVVDRYPDTDKPVTIRLTRYRGLMQSKPGPSAAPGRPLVMIHGYSASGNTFTHASLPTNAAAYFCERGRDVWVVDLRTSSGMPSCTYPWAMEQVGLIDIPAALLHIRSVTNQQVDVLAHCIGCVMLSMALLTDANEVRSSKIELGADTWLTNPHLGLLKAFNNPLPGIKDHPVIRKLILSQKGPVLRYTDDNIFRAFVLQSVRRWLMRDDYQFQPSDDPGVTEQLMDRLLASIPYPDADYDIENPFCPLALVPWTATRHRMDALYGRAFDASNMSPQTLNAINDIFGPINLETVSQTIHFARVDAITNQAGRGEFVTRDRLRDRWGRIDTYAIHGRNNGLVDVLTQTLLSERLRSAGVPFSEPREPAKTEVYGKLGHQDVLMGTSSRAVFDDLQTFLGSGKAEAKAENLPLVVTLPWSGPRLALPPQRQGFVRIACLSDPTQGSGRLYLVPAKRITGPKGERRFELIDDPACVRASWLGSSARWMFAKPDVDAMAVHKQALKHDEVLGWMALVVYTPGETKARLTALDSTEPAHPFAPAPAPAGSSRAVVSAPSSGRTKLGVAVQPAPAIDPSVPELGGEYGDKLHADFSHPIFEAFGSMERSREVLKAVGYWMERHGSDDVELSFVELANVQAARATARADTPDADFAFAFGSCQYVTGLVDAKVGQASLDRLAQAIDTDDGRVDLALFIGDQIYADATAGLIDPTRRDELYDQPNDKAMRASGMRAVLRRVPARMLLDDHELKDNWEPLPRAVARFRKDADENNWKALERGARAWAKFQRMRPLRKRKWSFTRRHEDYRGVGDLEFMAGGLPFRFTDTRTGRSARGSTTGPEDRKILNEYQWRDLQRWLLAQGDKVKFIVTPSILLPRRRTTAAGPGGSAHSDSWDAFPVSMDELFAFIVDHQITNTVFLSGDEHHSMIAEALLESRTDPAKPPVKIVSLHSSGLYAPYPFANGHPDDMQAQEVFSLHSVDVAVCTHFAPAGDGFARVRVEQGVSSAVLAVEWIKTGGQVFSQRTALCSVEEAAAEV